MSTEDVVKLIQIILQIGSILQNRIMPNHRKAAAEKVDTGR